LNTEVLAIQTSEEFTVFSLETLVDSWMLLLLWVVAGYSSNMPLFGVCLSMAGLPWGRQSTTHVLWGVARKTL